MREQTDHPLPVNTQVSPQEEVKDSEVPKDLLAVGSILGAIAASTCCVIPFVLFTLGLGGAWLGWLTVLAPYQPYILTLTLGFLGGGFYMVYRKPKQAVVCEGGVCTTKPVSQRLVKTALWAATLLVAVALAWPYIVPLLLG